MILIETDNLARAWEESFLALYEKGNELEDPEIFRDAALILKINNPLSANNFHDLFPMNEELIQEYNKFIISGGDKGNVQSEHVLYYERIFNYPPNSINQIKQVISKLKENPFSKRAQISFWDPEIDYEDKKVPCIQIIWFRIENSKLVMHVHMRACDVFKKILMNLNICIQLMKYVSETLNLQIGHYIHFVDSLHMYNIDIDKINEIYKKLKK